MNKFEEYIDAAGMDIKRRNTMSLLRADALQKYSMTSTREVMTTLSGKR